jgi:hypothetical protein
MIQGHAIYKRWNPETGETYIGKVWWTHSNTTPERAFLRRQKKHEKNGMSGWNSEIISQELRIDAPKMSDGLYHIRVAVNEHNELMKIPLEKWRNKQDPLIQMNNASSNEDMASLGGKITGRRNVESGQIQALGYSGIGGKKAFELHGNPATPESCFKGGKVGGKIGGNRRFKLYGSPATTESCSKGGKIIGQQNVESGHIQTLGCLQGRRNVESGLWMKANHFRWHVNQGISKPETCIFCVVSEIL